MKILIALSLFSTAYSSNLNSPDIQSLNDADLSSKDCNDISHSARKRKQDNNNKKETSCTKMQKKHQNRDVNSQNSKLSPETKPNGNSRDSCVQRGVENMSLADKNPLIIEKSLNVENLHPNMILKKISSTIKKNSFIIQNSSTEQEKITEYQKKIEATTKNWDFYINNKEMGNSEENEKSEKDYSYYYYVYKYKELCEKEIKLNEEELFVCLFYLLDDLSIENMKICYSIGFRKKINALIKKILCKIAHTGLTLSDILDLHLILIYHFDLQISKLSKLYIPETCSNKPEIENIHSEKMEIKKKLKI